ncbi:hypothetical protein P5719_011750, partial [Lactobacillus amylovorus]|uniref:hypothetical protein n=1 Tax=Lactobacillus amylovorus TaxID=1604 RepID=UPI00313F3BDA
QNLIKPIWYLCHNTMTAIIDQGRRNGTTRLDHPFSKTRMIIWTLYGRNYIDRHVAIPVSDAHLTLPTKRIV